MHERLNVRPLSDNPNPLVLLGVRHQRPQVPTPS